MNSLILSISGYNESSLQWFKKSETINKIIKIRKETLDLVYNIDTINSAHTPQYPTLDKFTKEYKRFIMNHIIYFVGRYKRIIYKETFDELAENILVQISLILLKWYQNIDYGNRSKIYDNNKLINEINNLTGDILYNTLREEEKGFLIDESFTETMLQIKTEARISKKKTKEFLDRFLTRYIPEQYLEEFSFKTKSQGRIAILGVREKLRKLVSTSVITDDVLKEFEVHFGGSIKTELSDNLKLYEDPQNEERFYSSFFEYFNAYQEKFKRLPPLKVVTRFFIYHQAGLNKIKSINGSRLNKNFEIVIEYFAGIKDKDDTQSNSNADSNNYKELAKLLGISIAKLDFIINQLVEYFNE